MFDEKTYRGSQDTLQERLLAFRAGLEAAALIIENYKGGKLRELAARIRAIGADKTEVSSHALCPAHGKKFVSGCNACDEDALAPLAPTGNAIQEKSLWIAKDILEGIKDCPDATEFVWSSRYYLSEHVENPDDWVEFKQVATEAAPTTKDGHHIHCAWVNELGRYACDEKCPTLLRDKP